MADLEQEDSLEALTAVVRTERAALVRVAIREGLAEQDGIESVQDALCSFLRLHRQGDITAPREEWGRLLAGMVRNAARNRRRRHAHARPHQPIVDEQPCSAPVADELLLRKRDRQRLRACVAELCAIQRAVVLLRLLDEQPGEDVAQALGISRGYVDVLTHRARASLRSCMLREPRAE